MRRVLRWITALLRVIGRWTGFREKKGWDWLQLIGSFIGLGSLIIAIVVFNAQRADEREQADLRSDEMIRSAEVARADLEFALESERAQQAAMQSYLTVRVIAHVGYYHFNV